MSKNTGPEIVFGLVGAIGADLDVVEAALRAALGTVNYNCETIKLSKLMHELKVSPWTELRNSPEYDRYDTHMKGGNAFRKLLERGDALALLAVGAIREARLESSKDSDKPLERQAYILNSLKHPAEVKSLRSIYGPSFFLIAAYSPREIRKGNLARKLASSEYSLQTDQFFEKAEALMRRDESEREEEEYGQYGQNVRDTFPVADFFVDASQPEQANDSAKRLVELIFDSEIHTPSRDEFGMFHAQAAALRSAALGRQVGATIATHDGDIVAVGTNEVPRAGGGLYWFEDNPDKRDFKLGYETSDRIKRRVLGDLITRMRKREWLVKEKQDAPVEKLIEEAFGDGPSSLMKGSQLVNSIEYFRAVHAEMAAIVDAARRGVAIRHGVLFTTTFPCHDCAKHIVAAGIQRVVFIEPYPKSLAPELYLDSIAVDQPKSDERERGAGITGYVRFDSFVGVAPRQYMDLFVMGERKTKSGEVYRPDRMSVKPRFAKDLPPDLVILVKENQEFNRFREQLKAKLSQVAAPTKNPASAKNPQADVLQIKKPEVQSGA